MKDSEHIEEFLRFLREAELRHKAALEDMGMYEMQLQDIEHKLELCEVSYHETAKLGMLLKKVRQQRRVAKDTAERLSPVIDWTAKQMLWIICRNCWAPFGKQKNGSRRAFILREQML